MTVLKIGTRGSALALWQANEVAGLLMRAGHRAEILEIRTTGDKRQDVPLAAIGGKGLFIKELEEALERGEIDLAVHSLKDVPSILPDAFHLAAFLERADARDAWIQPEGISLAELPPGTIVGTSAPRRRAQLRSSAGHVELADMRGNVDTRLKKVREGVFGAAVLAAAGMIRLGRAKEITSYFSVEQMLPAAGQGIIAIEARTGDTASIEAAASINHADTAMAARCERGVLQRFGTVLDCYSAAAVHATAGKSISIRAFIGQNEGARAVRASAEGSDPEDVMTEVYEQLVAAGAREIVEASTARGAQP